MRPFYFLFCLLPVLATAQQADILIKNGKILDGTGNSWYYADVAVTNGKIVAIGKLTTYTASQTLDAKGLIVAPGFIDVHTHCEGDEKKNPLANNFLLDGVTTVVTGNCGSSNTNLAAYFALLDSVKMSINIASLVGHNDVRKAVMGTAMRDPNEAELQQMEAIVAKAMQDGAVGLSTGLIYIPGTYSKTSEVVRLAKVAASYGGVYASHMRDEGDSVVEAINEAIYIGRVANMPVEISHFKLSGQQNWGRSKQTVAMIAAARKEGLDVTIDQYPYTASSTNLGTLMPDWIMADGQDSIVARLSNPAIQQQVAKLMLQKLAKRKLKHFSYPVVAYFKADTTLNGKSIEQVNQIKGKPHTAKDEAYTVMEMIKQGGAQMVFHGMGDEDVKRIMQYPFNMFASDASIRQFGVGAPHPRGYGTNARVLAKYVRDEHVISLEEAIRRMTSLPAQKFQLKNRGLLKEGFAADIVVFNEATVQDLSTYEQPHQYSTGFKYVLVNGKLVIDNGQHNGTRSGMVLRK
ncbi:amidohydrolase family protein [Parasediminibacterium paludis]|uniref:Amidohydrolase family protein n=1 Tax=Parasediminibacterium paludis TaxID=908966 RepID=A0ABV8PT59_9BACT